jgi:hypothetical protein
MQQEIIEVRHLTIQDYADLKSSMLEVYRHWPGFTLLLLHLTI